MCLSKLSVTIFDYLKDILVDKKGNLPLDAYAPYLVTRWLSFLNPTVASFVNEVNTQVLLEDKELHYKTMITLFPKMKFAPKINYIKKTKEEESEKDSRVSILANNYEISEREILSYIA